MVFRQVDGCPTKIKNGHLLMMEYLRQNILQISYYNWWLVGIYIILLTIFLFGILQPRKKTEWKSAGVAQAWVIALYAEMYGVPLTAYWVMGWLGRSQADAEIHYNGHLWPLVFAPDWEYLELAQFWFTVVGQFCVLSGAILAILGWRQLYQAVKENRMADRGLYRYIRHPQYTGFFLFLLGSVINWPTAITLLTLPILCWVYWRLARMEENDSLQIFGERYRVYMANTGRFLPGIGRVTLAVAIEGETS